MILRFGQDGLLLDHSHDLKTTHLGEIFVCLALSDCGIFHADEFFNIRLHLALVAA